MKAVLFVSMCALMALHETVANEILGRFDTSNGSSSSSTVIINGHSHSSSSSASNRQYTSWEVQPDGTCIKRVVEEQNGVTIEDSVAPIDCGKARQEVRDQTRIQFNDQILTLKNQQDTISNLHSAFVKKTESELRAMQNLLKVLN